MFTLWKQFSDTGRNGQVPKKLTSAYSTFYVLVDFLEVGFLDS